MPPATPLMRDEHGLSQALIENHQFIVCKQLFMCSNRLHLPRILGLRCGNAAEGTPLVSKPNQEMHKRTGMENNWLLHDFACLLPIPSCKRLSIGRVYIGYSALKVERSVSLSLEEPRPARSILNGSCIRLTNFCCYWNCISGILKDLSLFMSFLFIPPQCSFAFALSLLLSEQKVAGSWWSFSSPMEAVVLPSYFA